MNKILTIAILLGLTLSVYSQPINWQNADLQHDSLFGISTEKTYSTLLKGRIPDTVLVAVIDGGVDTAHEDIKAILWRNPKENFNNKDDDKDGYTDDIFGWNFIGGAKGNVQYDNFEITRIIREKRSFFDSLSYMPVPVRYQEEYREYQKEKTKFNEQLDQTEALLTKIATFKRKLTFILKQINKENPTLEDFRNYQPVDEADKNVQYAIIQQLRKGISLNHLITSQIDNAYILCKKKIDYYLNLDYDPRTIVGDDYKNFIQRYYGNNDVTGPDASHGTHVAGIIGGIRNNKIGLNGVANCVKIMSIRVIPDGDERDKDIANAILYAVNKGVKIINMSFDKEYSPEKYLVDEAIRYAVSKDILIIHASGNDGKDLDKINNFPNRRYLDGNEAASWIEVGASGWKDDSTLIPLFSNFGRKNVDVFAPGVQIFSSIPGSRYEKLDGTSMAAPVVTGLAAMIRGYCPKLTATEVKCIILNTVTKVNHNVAINIGNGYIQSIPFSETCISGGIVNAYNAMKLALNTNK